MLKQNECLRNQIPFLLFLKNKKYSNLQLWKNKQEQLYLKDEYGNKTPNLKEIPVWTYMCIKAIPYLLMFILLFDFSKFNNIIVVSSLTMTFFVSFLFIEIKNKIFKILLGMSVLVGIYSILYFDAYTFNQVVYGSFMSLLIFKMIEDGKEYKYHTFFIESNILSGKFYKFRGIK
jgi:hypothetical protein